VWTVPLLPRIRTLYLPNAGAFMPRFAAAIAQRPEPTVVTIAQYDKTLLAYYLARLDGRSIGWHSMDAHAKRIEPLIMVHALDAGSEKDAADRLEQLIAAGPILVIERDALLLPSLVKRLTACELLLQAPNARLMRCAPGQGGLGLRLGLGRGSDSLTESPINHPSFLALAPALARALSE
jgi:hypothetical protein